jgi:hypothetical protein
MTQALGDGETAELVRVLRACRDALVELSRTPSDAGELGA